MTRRTAIVIFELGQIAIAAVAFRFVATAPDAVTGVFYLGMLALLSLAVTAIYAILGTLNDSTTTLVKLPPSAVITLDPNFRIDYPEAGR